MKDTVYIQFLDTEVDEEVRTSQPVTVANGVVMIEDEQGIVIFPLSRIKSVYVLHPEPLLDLTTHEGRVAWVRDNLDPATLSDKWVAGIKALREAGGRHDNLPKINLRDARDAVFTVLGREV